MNSNISNQQVLNSITWYVCISNFKILRELFLFWIASHNDCICFSCAQCTWRARCL